MAEPCFRFRIVCPECQREAISELQIAGVAAALLKGDVIQLYASCHDVYWNAQPTEVEELRQYLASAAMTSEPISTGALDATVKSRHDLLPVL